MEVVVVVLEQLSSQTSGQQHSWSSLGLKFSWIPLSPSLLSPGPEASQNLVCQPKQSSLLTSNCWHQQNEGRPASRLHTSVTSVTHKSITKYWKVSVEETGDWCKCNYLIIAHLFCPCPVESVNSHPIDFLAFLSHQIQLPLDWNNKLSKMNRIKTVLAIIRRDLCKI